MDEFKKMDGNLDPATITEFCKMIGGGKKQATVRTMQRWVN